jgi:hypothetical protein
MKKCSGCKEQKDLSCFNANKSKRDGLNHWCKDCNRAASRKHYLENKDQRIKDSYNRSVLYRKKIDEYIASLSLSCCVCGEAEPVCLDFHHLDPREKEYNVASMKNKCSVEKIKKEISKCISICANCHRKFHAGLISLPNSP